MNNQIPDKTARWLAYAGSIITGVVVLALSESKSKEIKTHAWQSIWLFIALAAIAFVSGILDGIPVIGGLFYMLNKSVGLLWFILTLVCIISAVDNKFFKIPGIYQLAEKSASN